MLSALALIIFGLLDLAAIGGILTASLRRGISPDPIGFRRHEDPAGFWLSVGIVVLLGTIILAIVAGGLLTS
jgi:hypothetical protein